MTGSQIRAEICRFAADQRGATAIEYAIIASGISVAIIVSVWAVGATVRDDLFQKVADAMASQ
jgi:pilus assembly protein Flp/PilA